MRTEKIKKIVKIKKKIGSIKVLLSLQIIKAADSQRLLLWNDFQHKYKYSLSIISGPILISVVNTKDIMIQLFLLNLALRH